MVATHETHETHESLENSRGRRIPFFGAIGFWGGIVGGLSALVLLLYPPEVPLESFSYPFRGMGFTIAQMVFALQHVTMLLVLVGLLWAAAGRSRLARGGVITAIVGLAGLSAMELMSITAADSVAGESLYDAMSALYGIPTILAAVGLVLGGIGIIRARVWRESTRILPLALGAYVFVVLMPALVAGPWWAARVVIGIWCLLFAVQGWILWRGSLSRIAASRTAVPS